jgi:hypothetical protein
LNPTPLIGKYNLVRRSLLVISAILTKKHLPDSIQNLFRHICLTYDGPKDIFKLFVTGKKVDSGSWTRDGTLEVVRQALRTSTTFQSLKYIT